MWDHRNWLRFLMLMKVCAVLFTLGILLSFLSKYSWLGELSASFMLQLFYLGLVLPFVFFFLKLRMWAIALLGVCLIQGYGVFQGPYTLFPTLRVEGQEHLRILQYNVHHLNEQPSEFVDWLKANHESCDIVFLVEMTPNLRKKLTELREEYPYAVNRLKDQWFTQAILSKVPIASHDVKYYGQSSHYYSVTRFLTKAGVSLDLYGVHLTTPLSRSYWIKRNEELSYVSKDLLANPLKNKILIGDFNTTPYSQTFTELLSDAKLVTASYSVFENTWPTWLPQMARISLDHCLVTDQMQVFDRTVGPNLGSDHLPVMTEVALVVDL